MGIAFPMAEVISTYIPPSFYEVSEMRLQLNMPHYLTCGQFPTNNNALMPEMPTKAIKRRNLKFCVMQILFYIV